MISGSTLFKGEYTNGELMYR